VIDARVAMFDSMGAALPSLDLSNLDALEYIPEGNIFDVQFSSDTSYSCPIFAGIFCAHDDWNGSFPVVITYRSPWQLCPRFRT
jgi:hypothetical protein